MILSQAAKPLKTQEETTVPDRSRQGKAAWAARALTYQEELADQIAEQAARDTALWAARGRAPLQVRLMARLARRPLQLPGPVRER
jgi:hypothetical protein